MPGTFTKGISTVEVIGWQGHIQRASDVGAPFSRMGQSGSEVNLTTGNRATPSTIGCASVYTSLANAEIAVDQLMAFINDFITVTEPYDGSTPITCLCLGVQTRIMNGNYSYDGTCYSYRIDITISLEYQP